MGPPRLGAVVEPEASPSFGPSLASSSAPPIPAAGTSSVAAPILPVPAESTPLLPTRPIIAEPALPRTSPLSGSTPSSAYQDSTTDSSRSGFNGNEELSAALQDLLSRSPSTDEGLSPAVQMPEDIKDKFLECLNLYDLGPSELFKDPVRLKRLEALLDDLVASSDRISLNPPEQRFLSALNMRFPSVVDQQKLLSAEDDNLTTHFLLINTCREKAVDSIRPLASSSQEEQTLVREKEIAAHKVARLRQELLDAEAELADLTTRAEASTERAKREHQNAKEIHSELTRLMGVHSSMKRRKLRVTEAQTLLEEEWRRLRSLL